MSQRLGIYPRFLYFGSGYFMPGQILRVHRERMVGMIHVGTRLGRLFGGTVRGKLTVPASRPAGPGGKVVSAVLPKVDSAIVAPFVAAKPKKLHLKASRPTVVSAVASIAR